MKNHYIFIAPWVGLLFLLFLAWIVQATEPQPVPGESQALQTKPPKAPAAEPSPAAGQPKPPEDDHQAELGKFLGDMKPILAEAQKVEVYLVGPELADASVPEKSKLAGYLVLKAPVIPTEAQVKTVQALLLDEKSYFWGPAQKCLLHPDAALRFIKGETEVSILLSTECQLWSFAYQGKLKTKDYSPVGKTVGEFLTALFPKEFPAETR